MLHSLHSFAGPGPATMASGPVPATMASGPGPATVASGPGPATMASSPGPATMASGPGPATMASGPGPCTCKMQLGTHPLYKQPHGAGHKPSGSNQELDPADPLWVTLQVQ